jgi:hypothetical protein
MNRFFLPDFQSIKSRERIMVFAPNRQEDVKTISPIDIDTDKELDHRLHLCIDQMCKHKDQRLRGKKLDVCTGCQDDSISHVPG